MRHATRLGIVLFLLATTAAAQQRPIFDPDDYVDPEQHAGRPVFISRLVIGVAQDFVDDYRPLGQGAGFAHIATSFYWKRIQFDYKRSEVRGEDASGPERVDACTQCENRSIVFPTPPPDDATPAAPLPGSKDTLQIAWYHGVASGSSALPLALRYRLSWSRQPIETIVTSIAGDGTSTRLSGREESYGVQADTHVRFRGRDFFGELQFARTVRSGTIRDRSQNELVYTGRFPALAVRRVLFRPMLTVGGVSGRGATGLNVVNPAVEAFWHDTTTRVNFHLVYSPQATRSGAEGWKTTHQIAFFIDRALFVKIFGARP